MIASSCVSKMSLGKALDSGDLKSAQDAYAKIKKAMSQKPPAGGPGGNRGASGASGPGGGSPSNKTYDVKDTNKDGTVSAQEEYDYELTHPQEAKKGQATSQATDSTANGAVGETINIQA